MSTQTFHKTPSVFSFQRGILVSDGAMFNLVGDEYLNHPLMVFRHGIRGTQGVSDKNETPSGPEATGSAKSGERNVGNIQQTESAKCAHDADGAVVTFGLRMLNLEDAIFSCAAQDVETTNAVRASVMGFVERAKSSDGLKEVSCRVARNICNGSWLWRNRVMAQDIRVEVFHNDKHLAIFDALTIPLNKFGDYSIDEKKVADVLAAGMRGDRQANLEVRAFLKFGVKGSVELFPSQAYIEEKSSGYARVLYKIDGVRSLDHVDQNPGHEILGQAGLRDQKISNRLRTIDTWYKDYELIGKAIPVEPNGANLDLMQFFRKDRKDSAFAMLSRLNELDPNSPDGMFTIAIMMRGGVLGESDRKLEKSGKKAGKGKAGKAGKTEEGRDPAAAE